MKKFFSKLNIKHNLGYFFATLFLLLGVAAICSAFWFYTVYGDLGFDSVIFTMLANGGGVETGIVSDYMLRGLLPIIVTFAALCFLLYFNPKKHWKIKTKKGTKTLYPFTKKVRIITCYVLSAIFIFFGAFISRLSARIVTAFQTTTFFEENYVYPENTKITFPEEKRNLIYIFLESMESTFLSKEHGGEMEEEIAPELYQLALDNVNFSHNDKIGGFYQLKGCQWTSGGLVSHTTGIPLKYGIRGDEAFSNGDFLPNAINITNILKQNGYYQTLMVGSNAKYGNRSDFFKIHGVDQIYDLYTAQEDGIIPKDYFVWWGMEDKYLYRYAKDKLTEISKGDKPFAFSMLTVDTHFPQGYKCDLCGDDYENQYENVISCASRQLNEFIEWIKQQPFYANTTIVIVGDHRSMDHEYMVEVGLEDDSRTVYNCIINPAINPINTKNRVFSSIDMFPTTLAALGCTIEGNRLGLGTNLFSDKPTITEEYGFDYVDAELQKESTFYYNTFYK